MPVYRKDSEVRIIPSDDFVARNKQAESEALAEARVAKMKMNLSSKEYQQAFEQYKLQQEEHKQRMAQISLSTKQYQQQNSQRSSQKNPVEPTTHTESSNVLKHFKLMKRITGT